MLKLFVNEIKELYNNIQKNNKKCVEEFREKWNIQTSIGDKYESIVQKESRKKKGSFYTPVDVFSNINKDICRDIISKDNFQIKILDPSCGGGYFLVDIYQRLEKELVRVKFKNYKQHIIDNMLFGYDIDNIAILISIIELYYISGYISKNIKNIDFLINNEDKDMKYDYIVGNPPYIGHKVLDGEYRKKLTNIYGDVFYNKGDLSFCFIKKSIDILKLNGRLCFFTSRYILESLYGEGVRKYITSNSRIINIVDFYGVRIIKGVGVDSIILTISKESSENNSVEYFRVNSEAKDKGAVVFDDINSRGEVYTRNIKVNQIDMNPIGWSFLTIQEREIIGKIDSKCVCCLENIVNSFQGIITGKDDAFITTPEEAKINNIEESLLKPWIKGKNVNRFFVNAPDKLIIYSDIIDNDDEYKNALLYLAEFKEKLSKRRECLRGVRKWYNIQWGRKANDFNGKKIIFPYKSEYNRFAIDTGNYFSADIYALKLKSENTYSYEFLECVLNSSFYEFYIKTIAKKLGDRLYEYYPNKIVKVPIPKELESINEAYKGKDTDINIIDSILKYYFQITDEEFTIIRSYCGEF
ncbi:MAG: N-6 DNA methylase [Clostridium sp.]